MDIEQRAIGVEHARLDPAHDHPAQDWSRRLDVPVLGGDILASAAIETALDRGPVRGRRLGAGDGRHGIERLQARRLDCRFRPDLNGWRTPAWRGRPAAPRESAAMQQVDPG